MIDEIDTIALTRRYVDASNAHDLAAVRSQLAENISYSSSGVGEHAGRDTVMEMMTGFFTRFPDVHWSCEDYRVRGDNGAEFEFVLRATAADDGVTIERNGNERLFFDAAGLVRRIEVRDLV